MGQLAEQVKKKYPGAYDGKTDAEIESAIIAKYPGKYDHLATKEGLPPNITLPDGSMVSSAYKGGERKDRRFIDTDKLRESMITGASKTPFPKLAGTIGDIGIQGLELFNDPEAVAVPGLLKGINSRVLPSAMPEVVAPRAVPNIGSSMPGNREVIPNKFPATSTTEMPNVESPTLYHGTRTNVDKFDTTKNQPHGLFPNRTRFTEDPKYSEMYSLGESGGKKRELRSNAGNAPNTIAAKVSAKNVLDLTKPVPRDQIIKLQEIFKELKGSPDKITNDYIFSVISSGNKDIPFDAVRFAEHGQVNWAVKEGVTIKTPWGTDLTAPKVQREGRIRANDPSEGRRIMEEITGTNKRPPLSSETGALNVTIPNVKVPKMNFTGTDIINAPKAAGAALDISFPGRQGLWMVGRKQWYKSWKPMMRSLTSEDSYRQLQDSITNHPKFVEAVNNGLSLTDFAGVIVPKGMKNKAIGKLAQQEEQFGNRLIEQFTGGQYSPFRASNRAYSAFANNLRMSMYDDLTNKASRLAQKGAPVADRKMLAEYINTGSGRGSMGLTVGGKNIATEKAAELLNTVFWSPRFLASRVQLLNVPGNLMKMDKFTRQEYLRDLVTSVTAGGTVLGIANLAGADVNLNPLEADFMKAKINNTRVDLTGGFSPLIRFISQGVNGILDISEKGATGPSAMKFLESKLSPSAHFFKELVSGKDYFNRDVSIGQSALNAITPMIARDFYELYQNDPFLFPVAGLPSLVGASVQSYKDRSRGGMPSLSTSFPKMPSISD